MNGDARARLPQYSCHKQVGALKITEIVGNSNNSADLIFADGTFAPITVDAEYVSKHKPQVGGYYVVYEGGYESWSPADVFEKGYTKIEGE